MYPWASAHIACARALYVAVVHWSTICQSKRAVVTASFWGAWPHSANACPNVVVTRCTTVDLRDAAKVMWFPEASSVNGYAADESATTLSMSNVATVKSSLNTCRAVCSQLSVVGLAMIRAFRSVAFLRWCLDMFPVRLECVVDMLSTILNANNVATDRYSQDSRHVSRSSVADITTIKRLINAATDKFFPGSGGVLSQPLTINFVGAISSILLFNNVAMERLWLP